MATTTFAPVAVEPRIALPKEKTITDLICDSLTDGTWKLERWDNHRTFERHMPGDELDLMELGFTVSGSTWDLYRARHNGRDIKVLLDERHLNKFVTKWQWDIEWARRQESEARIRKSLTK